MRTGLIIITVCLVGTIVSGCKNRKTTEQKMETLEDTAMALQETVSVERLSPKLDDIIPPGEIPEIIAEGFDWSEGPLWLPEQERLLFSDIPENSVFQWSENDGLKLYLKPAGYTDTISRGGETGSNGLLLDPDSRLVLCQHGDRRMARMDSPLDNPDSRFVTLADNWQDKRFNSPNDATYNSKGELLFTDPAYGMELRWEDPKREMDFAGVFKLTTEGEVILLTDTLQAPNGIGLSPAEDRLYVASSGTDASWYEYTLAKDGSLAEGKVFFDGGEMKKTRKGSPDGLVIRSDGIIFASGPGGILVFTPDADHLGTILTGQATSNCTLDDKESYLYMTADMYVMRIRLK